MRIRLSNRSALAASAAWAIACGGITASNSGGYSTTGGTGSCACDGLGLVNCTGASCSTGGTGGFIAMTSYLPSGGATGIGGLFTAGGNAGGGAAAAGGYEGLGICNGTYDPALDLDGGGATCMTYGPLSYDTAWATSSPTTSCHFPIPTPPAGQVVDPQRVQLEIQWGLGSAHEHYSIVNSIADCINSIGGYYFDNPNGPLQVILCPCTCRRWTIVTGDVVIRFGCRPTTGPG